MAYIPLICLQELLKNNLPWQSAGVLVLCFFSYNNDEIYIITSEYDVYCIYYYMKIRQHEGISYY